MKDVARDRAMAKERMRRLRAAGPTISDRARNAATRELVVRHREEFAELLERCSVLIAQDDERWEQRDRSTDQRLREEVSAETRPKS